MNTAAKTHAFYVGEIDNAFYSISSKAAPFFCIQGTTEEESVSRAKRALDFFNEAAGMVRQVPHPPQRTVSTFVPKREELLCA